MITLIMASFGVLVVVSLAVNVHKWERLKWVLGGEAEARFWRSYLAVYLMVMASDWLQGPYIYALYESYGYAQQDISMLFVAGFGASMVLGPFVGALSDRYGRRLMALVFCATYAASCATKLSTAFPVLMVGRLLSGAATSLLFSVFESWMIHEHHERSYGSESLSELFSIATAGNGIVAVLMGVVATALATQWGPVAPHMGAMLLLALAAAVISRAWPENFGSDSRPILEGLQAAAAALIHRPELSLLGMCIALFEAAMYSFVFVWTPVLQDLHDDELPLGIIFSAFMGCVVLGSALYIPASARMGSRAVMAALLAISAVALTAAAVGNDAHIAYGGFLLFEIMCGVFFPCAGKLRSECIPEDVRATVMNFFRVPLNLVVVAILLHIGDIGQYAVLMISSVLLSFGTAGALVLYFLSSAGAAHDID